MTRPQRSELLTSEDWWAIWAAGLLIVLASAQLLPSVPTLGRWAGDVSEAFAGRGLSLVLLALGLALLTGLQVVARGGSLVTYQAAFAGLFLLGLAAFVIAQQAGLRASGLGYAFWSPVLGLLIANTAGTPGWLRPALRGEFFIRIGLVLLGAEVLFGKILTLGGPGLLVAWGVTPVVLVFMFWLGTRVLKMTSPTLVIVIAAATSICGISAAVAAASAARAKKEELMVAVGLTVVFTVVMMVGMPLALRSLAVDPVVAGALIGGTVDATGAVIAAAAMLGDRAEQVAAIVKMVQNMLIGIVALGIAVYWASRVERSAPGTRPGAAEIWSRLPKFILGFVAASLVFSFVLTPTLGDARVAEILGLTSRLRSWLFCLGFVAIGLDADLRDLLARAARERSIQLYVVGQAFNVALTFVVAYLAFGGILFEPPL